MEKIKIESSNNNNDGRIVSVYLKNFLTYDDCMIRPGESLNVILGPNGTGKSSIVCAICLGLGGSPTLLGRAKEIGDYVKHRTKQATIEIELLRTNGPNLVVKRVINKTKKGETLKGVSVWYLNGKESNQKAVTDTVSQLNVQMNNLCQFLPQDKVAEFTKMSNPQLLEATEKAVGPPGMHSDHMKLIELRKKYINVDFSKAEKEGAKERVEQRNQQLEREVQRHKEREKHQEKILMLEKKKPWVEYENARLKFITAKKDKAVVEKQIVEARKVNAPIALEIDNGKERVGIIDADLKAMVEDGNKTVKSVKQLNDKLDKQQERIDDIKVEVSEMKNEQANRDKKITKLQRDIASLQKDYDEAPDPAVLKPQADDLASQTKDLSKLLNQFDREGRELQGECSQAKAQSQGLKNQIRQLESSDNQRLETLRRNDKAAYDAVLWLREHKDMFSGTVYEPIMTQINMKDIKDAVYVESSVSFRDMTAFVCQNRQDQNLFSNQMRDVLKLNVPVVCPPMDAQDEYYPNNSLESIKQYGFQSYVTDMFTCPKTIKQYLCENFYLHNIPLGNEYTEKIANQVTANVKGLPRFFTKESIFSVKKSKYKNDVSTTVGSISKNCKYLNVGVDLEQKKHLDAELADVQAHYDSCSTKYNQIKTEMQSASKKKEALVSQRNDIVKQMKIRQTLANQIETKQKRLESEQKDMPDIEKEEQKALKKIATINKTRINLTKDYRAAILKCIEIGKERVKLSMKQVQDRVELEKLEQKYRQSSETLRSLEEAHTMIAKRCVDLKVLAKRLLKTAQDKTGAAEALVPDSLREVFETLPDTVEEIEGLINEEQARLNCQYQSDPSVLKDYEKNKKEIFAFASEIEDLTAELNNMQTQINELIERWLVPLENLIRRINEQYCDFFRRMGCAGEVLLEKDPDDDYKKYGVLIRVKFREENKLKNLTSTFQSGGERSVSTMLYLISLQELTKCPFRLVDEINQGMDPNNERRVFELVVETVCRPNTSQYFLITPKLLPDLKYTDRMTILTVLNGHWMLPHHAFDVKDFIRRRKHLTEENNSRMIGCPS